MRIITGTARGKRLRTLPGERVRPTTERVKEGLFSALQFDIPDRRVLDLFAGSGQLGLEALSRGAAHAVFVDNARASIQCARQNAEDCGFEPRAQFLQTDALHFLHTTADKFSLVLLDPPYADTKTAALSLLEEVLAVLEHVLTPDAIVCCESPIDQPLPRKLAHLVAKEYTYGKTKVTIYRA
ncbi:MAG: 16S rRNA (guanine(966)-N(2))-methyltransferase RsmD [Oscillospiraceae bacterium]|nr:16S rRNA (guanine(966)-N(2))-methyltransferase RsmD [Oscillospiraceae bacterium]